MDASIVFQIVNTIVLPAWIILIFFPKKSWRNPMIYGFSMLMAVVYVFYVLTSLGDLDMEAFSELEGVKAMFSSNEAVLTGWVHYLVFDLLVGNWIANNAHKYKINHYVVIPCLIFCFMFGPLGYLLYSVVKLVQVRNLKD